MSLASAFHLIVGLDFPDAPLSLSISFPLRSESACGSSFASGPVFVCRTMFSFRHHSVCEYPSLWRGLAESTFGMMFCSFVPVTAAMVQIFNGCVRT